MNRAKHRPEEIGNMAPEEYEIAMELCDADPEFKDLWDEHRDLKDKLKALKEKSFLTTGEEMEVKRLKRIKLMGKDRIAEKIREYKVGVPSSE